MKIDNSSTSIVLDPKSQAAIDAVRDRITLLESENARLTKLKSNLDADVRKTEADLSYKADLLMDIETKMENASSKLDAIIAIEVDSTNTYNEMNEKIVVMQRDMDEQAASLTERERKINAREFAVDARTEILLDGEAELEIANALMQVKIDAIEALLTKL